jgi:hypothetical protein
MKDPDRSWKFGTPAADEAVEPIVITSAELATMAPSNTSAEAIVFELTGPPQAYFELPLDWFINQQAEIGPEGGENSIRLIQRVWYKNFRMIGPTQENVTERALVVIEAVRNELKRLGEIGYIWWRLPPKYQTEPDAPKGKPARHSVRLRLGTMPRLSTRFWLNLSKAVDNISSEPMVPRTDG